MNEILKETSKNSDTSKQTPIEIALGVDENGMTTARKLYEFLELAKGQFSRWAKTSIESNEFYEENKDWWGFDIVSNGNNCKDFKLTTDFAKHLSTESHSAKGKIARNYFVGIEEKVKEVGIATGKAYVYFSPVPVNPGDTVQINSAAKGVVVEVDVPEEEIAAYRDKVKCIAGLVEEEGEENAC